MHFSKKFITDCETRGLLAKIDSVSEVEKDDMVIREEGLNGYEMLMSNMS